MGDIHLMVLRIDTKRCILRGMKEFKEYFVGLEPGERALLAKRCKTSVGHLRNVAYGKTCGESLAIAIDRESRGTVRCESLRPDVDWAYLRGTASTVDHEKTPIASHPISEAGGAG